MKKTVKIEDLFAAGFQYGHRSVKTTPRMKEYVYVIKWGVSVIDLCKTSILFSHALEGLHEIVKKGGRVLFVGTKYQAKDLVSRCASECGEFYINKRWLGGSLTNYDSTIVKKVHQLKEIEKQEELSIIERLAKKEQMKIADKKENLIELIEGVREMHSLPDVMVVIDAKREGSAILEARKSGIPVIALADTDTPKPENIKYLVPGNDDGSAAINFMLEQCKSVILEAKSQREEKAPAQNKEATK